MWFLYIDILRFAFTFVVFQLGDFQECSPEWKPSCVVVIEKYNKLFFIYYVSNFNYKLSESCLNMILSFLFSPLIYIFSQDNTSEKYNSFWKCDWGKCNTEVMLYEIKEFISYSQQSALKEKRIYQKHEVEFLSICKYQWLQQDFEDSASVSPVCRLYLPSGNICNQYFKDIYIKNQV